MKKEFYLASKVEVYLNESSDYQRFHKYFQFLIMSREEILKSSSGLMKVVFPECGSDLIRVELNGYDTYTMSRTEVVESKNENNLKRKLIDLFENERMYLLEENEEIC